MGKSKIKKFKFPIKLIGGIVASRKQLFC